MWKHLVFCLIAVPVFAQHTLTITATRTVAVQPDHVVFGLSVSAGQTTNLDQVVASLSSAGITAANLSGVDSNNPPLVDWSFTLAVPISNLNSTINSLTALQQTVTGLTFSVSGTQASEQATCSNADLIADAKAQAQKLAAAANVTLGPVIQLSNSPAPVAVAQLFAPARLGAFVSAVAYVPPVTCSLSVQFQLLP
ncbi:MAG TPA: SIMPL domain-containing protein [Bryobacteraceae bacterium]|nr:SIMPL domain-containing protein [Bryobacteraceae bacterium]